MGIKNYIDDYVNKVELCVPIFVDLYGFIRYYILK